MIDKTMHGDNFNGDVRDTAEPAEAEDFKAASVPDKFKNVKALVKAYSELEAEFTRRSQRLRELEKRSNSEASPDGAKAEPSEATEDELIKSALSNGRVREAVIGEFLKGVAAGGAAPTVAGGAPVPAPRTVPKSVKEAGKLAREFLKGKPEKF